MWRERKTGACWYGIFREKFSGTRWRNNRQAVEKCPADFFDRQSEE
jgi:hypothetical protein